MVVMNMSLVVVMAVFCSGLYTWLAAIVVLECQPIKRWYTLFQNSHLKAFPAARHIIGALGYAMGAFYLLHSNKVFDTN